MLARPVYGLQSEAADKHLQYVRGDTTELSFHHNLSNQ